MPKPYSRDLRDRLIDAVERGGMSLSRRGAPLRDQRICGDQVAGTLSAGGFALAGRTWRSSPLCAHTEPGFSGGCAGGEARRNASGPLRPPLV